MAKFEVRLERAALEGFADLDRGDQKQVRKRLGRLEDDADQQGITLGHKHGVNLTGNRKLVLCNMRVRVIFQVRGEVAHVIVIGKREDLQVYREAAEELQRLGWG